MGNLDKIHQLLQQQRFSRWDNTNHSNRPPTQYEFVIRFSVMQSVYGNEPSQRQEKTLKEHINK
jgi:hypothetical protein